MSTPYDYYPAVLYALDLISQGHTPTQACDASNLPIPTFEAYIKRDPALQALYADAERRGHDALADALVNIDNHRIHGQSDARMAKVISDNIKWLLSKRDQKRFGERIEVKHELTMDRAIVQALEAARNRTAIPYEDPTLIDVTPVRDEDDAIMSELLS